MGNQESQPPYFKPLQPKTQPSSQPPLQVKSKIHQQKSPFKNQNVMPYQQLPADYQQVPQNYMTYSQGGQPQTQQLTESMVGNQRGSMTGSQSLTAQTMQRNVVSPINSLQQSNSNRQQPSVPSQTKIMTASEIEPEELPTCLIYVVPTISSSILKRESSQKSEKKFKIGMKVLDVDELKVQLRVLQKQVLTKLLPEFDVDIMKMNHLIELERQQKLKDKNKVLFLLMQRHHYIKLCKKFLDYNQKVVGILLGYRKKDCLEDISEAQINNGQQLRAQLDKLIKNIENDLPQKGWTALIQQPDSKYYRSVVNSAHCHEEVVNKYKQLEQSLVNPAVFENLVNTEMMESKTRRIGESQNKKVIEGPAFYGIDPIRNTKHPVA